jgi:hypothetical protein
LSKYQSTSGIVPRSGQKSHIDHLIGRWARKLGRVAQACLRLVVAAVVVGAGVIYFSFGSLSPCSILREAIRQRDDFAAVLPDGIMISP